MADANQTAEAVLIVIKRIFKWIVIALIVVIVCIGLVAWVLDYTSTIEYRKKQEQENMVSIVASRNEEQCTSAYPYFYGIVNNSEKTVNNVKFTVEIRRKGFSSALNSYTSIDEDKILKPGEGYGRCFRATKKDYDGDVKDKDVDIIVTYKVVTFQDK
jgi:hypothetical protein